jgi:hypothetical protein
MEAKSAIQQRFIDHEVAKALIRSGLPYDSPVRQKLNSDAEIIGPPGEGFLRMRNDRGELVSVDDRIKELKTDPSFRACFPELPKIARSEGEQIGSNFDRIARGEVEVVK